MYIKKKRKQNSKKNIVGCSWIIPRHVLGAISVEPTDVYVQTDPLLSDGSSKQLQLVVIPFSAVTGGKKPMTLHEEASLYPHFCCTWVIEYMGDGVHGSWGIECIIVNTAWIKLSNLNVIMSKLRLLHIFLIFEANS